MTGITDERNTGSSGNFQQARKLLMFPLEKTGLMNPSSRQENSKLLICKWIENGELKLSNTWVSFLNVSLNLHADFIAGRQLYQTWRNNFWIFIE